MNRDTPLARPLFTNRRYQTDSHLKRRALKRKTNRAPNVFGLVFFSFVLLAAILLPVVLHNDSHYNVMMHITNLIDEDIPQFLSSYPMNNSTLPSWVDYRGQFLIMGKANARSCALIMGIVLSVVTYFCVYYNSAIPGELPLSPHKGSRSPHYHIPQSISSGIAMSYKMVPVNGVVFGLATLIFLRLYLNVPF